MLEEWAKHIVFDAQIPKFPSLLTHLNAAVQKSAFHSWIHGN